ncbi:MAG: protein translocase subunit SecD [Deltaproteobacteria bacterium]|nr:protein translocase subunit SecD [Deltaproteobacteria bacterium]
MEQRADRLADRLRDDLKEQGFAYTRIDRPKDTSSIVVSLVPETDVGSVQRHLRKQFPVLVETRRADAVLTLDLDPDEVKEVKDSAVEQAIKTIRNRADRLGVTEPTIARRGEDNVLIQLPGVEDPERAIELIGRTAQLEFKIVDEKASWLLDEIAAESLPQNVARKETTVDGPNNEPVREVYFELPEGKEAEVLALVEQKLPSDRVLAFGEPNTAQAPGQLPLVRTYVLNARPGITGDYLGDARVEQNPDLPTDFYVSMTFDPQGAKIFEKLTEENVRRRMAIVLDGKLNSAPVIQEKIGGGSARITLGSASNAQARFNEARDLSLVLKAGALPAPVEIREKRQVGKSLGEEAIKQGSLASVVGGIVVVLFMLLYYRASGALADVALGLNLLLLLAALSMFGATLTLPGIAGIALTIGMAVDANVIICERIREELRIGKTPRAAVESGYSRAFRAIFDSNVTTLIAGVVLYQYGSGPVRGFAVTMMVGILASMFTAIVLTRVVYDFVTTKWRLRTLSI